jgi:hypothetical protein
MLQSGRKWTEFAVRSAVTAVVYPTYNNSTYDGTLSNADRAGHAEPGPP